MNRRVYWYGGAGSLLFVLLVALVFVRGQDALAQGGVLTELIPYGSTGYRYLLPSGDVLDWQQISFDDSSWNQGDAAFGSGGQCDVQGRVSTHWPALTSLLVRRWVYVPPGATNLRLHYTIDSMLVQAHINGHQLNTDAIVTTGCPAVLEGELEVPAFAVQSGQMNLLAFWVLDFQPVPMFPIESFFDARLTADLPPGGSLLAERANVAVDGVISEGEWPDELQPFPGGFIAARSDGLRLYLLIDVLEDNQADPPLGPEDEPGDQFDLVFDVNRNRQLDAGVDRRLSLMVNDPFRNNYRFRTYDGTPSWGLPDPLSRTAVAPGFGCFFQDGSLLIDDDDQIQHCAQHRFWEVGVALADIGTMAGGDVLLGFGVESANPARFSALPPNYWQDFSQLLFIQQAANPPATYTLDPTVNYALDPNPLEVTQSIQTRPDSLPLVANKPAVARVYITKDSTTPQFAIVFLYGYQADGRTDLPGSPLLGWSYFPPKTINRANPLHTTNFVLPDAWRQPGEIHLAPVIYRLDTDGSISGPEGGSPVKATFATRKTPFVQLVPIFMDTATTEVRPDMANARQQVEYMRRAFPVPNVRLEILPSISQMSGTDMEGSASLLNLWIALTRLVNFSTQQITGQVVVEPDLYYGVRRDGDGTFSGMSAPVWWNSGLGVAAVGSTPTMNSEAILAHEYTHNLDTAIPPTWGTHAIGCDMTPADDPNWPFPNGQIQEVGLEWTGVGALNPFQLRPATNGDLMSIRCAQRWVSPYRWQALYDVMAPPTTQNRAAKAIDEDDQVYLVSGRVAFDGDGSLDPVSVHPGLPDNRPQEGSYRLEIVGPLSEVLFTQKFRVPLTSVEGQPVEDVGFAMLLPYFEDGVAIQLKHGSDVLDERRTSDFEPLVQVLAPNGGENWSGERTVRWSAMDGDGDPLTYMLQYTPDGVHWSPVATGLTAIEHIVDFGLLPGGDNATLRIIASDGFNTGSDDSDSPFVVATRPPQVWIDTPPDGQEFLPDQLIAFRGDAQDNEDDELPEPAFVWSYRLVEAGGPGPVTFFGAGREASATWPHGDYEVTLAVTDSDGQTAQETIVVPVRRVFRLFMPLIPGGPM